jgi:hypothetical protein
MRARPGWSAWLTSMSGDARVAAMSRLLDTDEHREVPAPRP